MFQDEPVSRGKAQAVPTDVAVGPDGALYVCELTGFPFDRRARPRSTGSCRATSRRSTPTDLTNVTSIAFGKDGKLYAVQIANHGLLTGPTGLAVAGGLEEVRQDAQEPDRRPVRAVRRGHQGRSAFVTIGAVAPGAGAVIKIPLG